jgi:hypothetical protein
MKFLSTAAALFGLLAGNALAQDVKYDSEHNMTSLGGTWASGSQKVLTGPGFAQPSNMSFTYPPVTGISYSFTNDGYFETARYRFNSNGTNPTCITGILIWTHGTYAMQPNGSIVLTPFGDGYQQVQDPCVAVTNFVQEYNQTELISSWRIFQDPQDGYKLHLFSFDGSPMAPMFQVNVSPNMLPTQKLRNSTAQNVLGRRSFFPRAFNWWE